MREKWNLFRYEVKNALVGMLRHWALCLSAVTTITLTLILVAIFVMVGVHVTRFSSGIGKELSIHVVLNESVQDTAIDYVQEQIEAVDNVDHARYSSKDDELEMMIAEKGEAFSIYRGEENPLSNAFYVYLVDETKIEETSQAIQDLPFVQSVAYGGTSVNSLVKILRQIRIVSFALALLMMILSLYLIYNTIRNTIYSRQDEINVMKTVGATPAFIRIPFEIEGILLGALGAIIPYLLVWYGYSALYDSLGGRLFITEFALMPVDESRVLFAWVLFGLGMFSGWLASAMAARKYLKKIR